jgi:hypothetical protein
MTTVCINKFVRRQTPGSEFSHYEGPPGCKDSWENLRVSIEILLENGISKPGYRDGVILVPCNPQYFFSGVVTLTEGTELRGSFKARMPGEEPRKSVQAVGGTKMPAKSVDVVLYASTVLAEDGDNDLSAHEDNWEIVSINASPFENEMPINPNVLMHNHFGSDGGTATNLSNENFVKMLRESFLFWKDKAMCCPGE